MAEVEQRPGSRTIDVATLLYLTTSFPITPEALVDGPAEVIEFLNGGPDDERRDTEALVVARRSLREQFPGLASEVWFDRPGEPAEERDARAAEWVTAVCRRHGIDGRRLVIYHPFQRVRDPWADGPPWEGVSNPPTAAAAGALFGQRATLSGLVREVTDVDVPAGHVRITLDVPVGPA